MDVSTFKNDSSNSTIASDLVVTGLAVDGNSSNDSNQSVTGWESLLNNATSSVKENMFPTQTTGLSILPNQDPNKTTSSTNSSSSSSNVNKTTMVFPLDAGPSLNGTTVVSMKDVQEQLQSAFNTTEQTFLSSIETFTEGMETIKSVTTNLSIGEPIPDLTCRVVATNDQQLPDRTSEFFPSSLSKSLLLYHLDAIFHAKAHELSSHLRHFDKRTTTRQRNNNSNSNNLVNQQQATISTNADNFLPAATSRTATTMMNGLTSIKHNKNNDYYNESEVIQLLKESLEDSGFVPLSQRDVHLCEALNVGYLLRLSIYPDLRDFGDDLAQQFFDGNSTTKGKELPFDGKVLIFRRGYSSEFTEGRLLVPKLDYLQASLVQRSASYIVDFFSKLERQITFQISQTIYNMTRATRAFVQLNILRQCPPRSIPRTLNRQLVKTNHHKRQKLVTTIPNNNGGKRQNLVRLTRYGGSKLGLSTSTAGSITSGMSSSLDSFLARPIQQQITDDDSSNNGNETSNGKTTRSTTTVSCEYDVVRTNEEDGTATKMDDPRSQQQVLLERVSIGDLFDSFFYSKQTKGRKRSLLKSFVSKSQLVEPTYEEVVVIWRPPTPKKATTTKKKQQSKTPKQWMVQLHKFVYDIAEIFAIDDQLPPPPSLISKDDEEESAAEEDEEQPPLEIRVFKNVELSNLPAVFPKTRLIFRPADAFLFDTISVFTLLAVLASQRFDNPKFDFIALVSVSLWLLRTFFRYSNKLARYDLLVKTFLTSKLAQRGSGALKYLVTEAGYQRSNRAALLFQWILDHNITSKQQVLLEGAKGICDQFSTNANVVVPLLSEVDIERTLNDLIHIGLIRVVQQPQHDDDEDDSETRTKQQNDEQLIPQDTRGSIHALRQTWISMFDDARKKG